MAYKCSFLDNESYTAQDVSDIFARVTCGGVLFTDTGYIFDDLNTAASSISSEGVTRDPDSCRVVKEDGIYKISKGACIMKDGTAITFDSNGYEIEVTEGEHNYVYLRRNVIENSIDVVVSAYPGDEDSVPLAEVDYLGTIYDRRAYAKAKVDVGTAGTLRDFTVNFTQCAGGESETVTVDFGDEDFNYAIFRDGDVVRTNATYTRVSNTRNLVELINGEEVLLSIGKYAGEHDEYVRLKKDGQNLHIHLTSAIPYADYTLNMSVI